MPRVPVIAPQENLRPLNTPNYDMLQPPAGAFGEGVAAGLMRGGDAAGQLYLKARKEHDDAVFLAAVKKYNDVENLKIDGDQGLRSMSGENAMERFDPIMTEFNGAIDEIEGSLPSDDVKQRFQEFRLSRDRDVLQRAHTHLRAQTSVVVRESTIAAVLSETNRAAKQPMNEERNKESLMIMRMALENQASAEGWPAEELDAKWSQVVSKFHQSMIESLGMGTNPGLALQYFEKHRDEIMNQELDEVKEDVKFYAARGQGLVEGKRMWDASGMDKEKALAMLDEHLTEPWFQDARQEIDRRAADAKEFKRERSESNYTFADEAFKAGGNRVSAIPTTVWRDLASNEQEYFRRLERGEVNDDLKLSQVDWKAWDAWKSKSREEMLSGNPVADLRGKVTASMLKEAVEEKSNLVAATKEPAKVKPPQLIKQGVDRELNSRVKIAGLDSSKARDKTRIEQFRQWMYDRIDAYQGTYNKAPDEEQLNRWYVIGLAKGEVEVRGINPNLYRFEVDTNPSYYKMDFIYDDIIVPERDAAAIRKVWPGISDADVKKKYLENMEK